ncbi:MAG: LysM peptidoglycan-binding domain-containing protein, partial [Bacteroidales bacterium]|nr:LysM peptidoglycan-binding domain-containing protein [Bacteroidales bacterium]
VNLPLAVDTVVVSRDIHLEQISQVLNLPLNELKALNPQYRTGFVPGRSKPMAITLPVDRLGDFIEMTDTITNFNRDQYLTTVNQTSSPTQSTYLPPDVKGKTKLIYVVKDGDNLGFISEWYGVGLSELRFWNNIYRNTIRIGQKLTVYVEPSRADRCGKIDSMSFSEKQKMIGKTVSQVAKTSETQKVPLASLPDAGYEFYTVRYGDTVWDIAKKFEGITAGEILKLNNISDASKIQVGQKLKIRKRS